MDRGPLHISESYNEYRPNQNNAVYLLRWTVDDSKLMSVGERSPLLSEVEAICGKHCQKEIWNDLFKRSKIITPLLYVITFDTRKNADVQKQKW